VHVFSLVEELTAPADRPFAVMPACRNPRHSLATVLDDCLYEYEGTMCRTTVLAAVADHPERVRLCRREIPRRRTVRAGPQIRHDGYGQRVGRIHAGAIR
jgi:hypothetical protein